MSKSMLRALAGLLLALSGAPAFAALTITPLTWDAIGLDSNNVNTGPDTFPVGARVCNVSGSASAPVTATFVRDGATNAFITVLTPGATLVSGTLPAGGVPASQYSISTLPANCYDFYFEVQVARNSGAYNTTQGYRITATNGTDTVQTPAGRQLFVEKLISQNRNGVDSFTGPSTVYVGQTVTYTVNGHTATGGYEQVEFAPVLPVLFQMLNVSVTMAVPTGGVNSAVYADACGWEPNPANADYWRNSNSDECHNADNYSGGKAGGDPVSLTYNVKAITAGSGTMTNVWYDYSGSSFHYNSDVGTGVNTLPFTVLAPSPITGTKSFSPSPMGTGGSSTLTITLNNPNAAPSQGGAGLSGVSFTDLFPTAPGRMTVASPLATSNTCGGTLTDNDALDADTTLEAGDGSFRLTGGTLPWSGSCTITIAVTAPVAGSYVNTIAAGAITTAFGGSTTNASAVSATLTVQGPSLAVVKSSVAYSDPYNAITDPKRIPGGFVNYALVTANSGLGAADSNSVVALDAVPAGTALYVGDLGGAGTGPVAFTQGTPTSGLTYTYTSLASATDDVSFSSDGGVTFTYTPVPDANGVDAAVTHVRINPKGVLAGDATAGAPSPNFTVAFRVRVE